MSTRTGIEHEEILLSESAARETSLNTQIIEMELDLKAAKVEVDRLKTEKSGAMIELGNLKQENSVLESELKGLKGEVKEYRFRETRLLTDYSELEEENVLLQKQVIIMYSRSGVIVLCQTKYQDIMTRVQDAVVVDEVREEFVEMLTYPKK